MSASLRASPPRTEAAIIAASLRDPPLFSALFDRHWPALHAYCTSRAGTAGEDIAAETFRVAFAKRRRYDQRYEDARPWLYGIATRLIQRHFRDAQRGDRAWRRSAALLDRLPDNGPAGELERQLLGPRLAAAVSDLPPADRDALLLWAWADLEYAEIARALDVPLGTVRSRLHRARGRIRDHLTEGTPDDR